MLHCRALIFFVDLLTIEFLAGGGTLYAGNRRGSCRTKYLQHMTCSKTSFRARFRGEAA